MAKPVRDTVQRHAIKSAFLKERRPLGPKEIMAVAGIEVPNLGIATVYRNIKNMVEENELEIVDIPGRPPRYCLPADKSSVLFVCEKTDHVFFMDESRVKIELRSLPSYYTIEQTSLILYGCCQE